MSTQYEPPSTELQPPQQIDPFFSPSQRTDDEDDDIDEIMNLKTVDDSDGNDPATPVSWGRWCLNLVYGAGEFFVSLCGIDGDYQYVIEAAERIEKQEVEKDLYPNNWGLFFRFFDFSIFRFLVPHSSQSINMKK